MATLTHSHSFDGIWAPDALVGGTILTRTATSMTYVSDAGYTVTIRGTGLTYDDDGIPSGGTLTRFTVVKDGQTFLTLTGASVDFARAGMLLFGYDSQDGGHYGPDATNFLQNALRGDDLISGSDQHDELIGTKGNDTILGGGDSDGIGGEQGDDSMDGGDGWDTLYFDSANFSWESYRGVYLDAAIGTATDCWGDTDTFQNFEHFMDSGYSDTLLGSDTDEYFNITRGNDLVNGRGGSDWVVFDQADRWGGHRGVTVNLDTGIARDSWGGTDTLLNIEGVRGTIFGDRLIGSARDEALEGGAGVDTINGAGGFDVVDFGNVGNGSIAGHGVTIDLSQSVNILDDGYGNAETARNIERFVGSIFGDRLTGDSGVNHFDGLDGNDTIYGGGGEDFLDGNWGNDRIFGGAGSNDHLNGGGGNDTLTGGAGNDNFNFVWDLVATGVDAITDFTVGVDLVWVGSWWGGGLVDQDLIANQFRSGAGVTTANSATQRFIYNTTTGDLYFDADGNETGSAAVRFATLSNLATLTFEDIHIQF